MAQNFGTALTSSHTHTSIIITGCDICGLHAPQAGVRSAPREWCNAHLTINQTSRSGAASGSMSEIGNVPIFSRSESRFREGLLAHDAAMIGVINAIIYGRLRTLRRTFELPRVPEATRKYFRSKHRSKTAKPSCIRSARILSRLSAHPLVTARLGVAIAKARHGTAYNSTNIFAYFNV